MCTEGACIPTAAVVDRTQAGAEREPAVGSTVLGETSGERYWKIPLPAPFSSSLPCELGGHPPK